MCVYSCDGCVWVCVDMRICLCASMCLLIKDGMNLEFNSN